MSSIGEKSITVRKKEVDGTSEVIDFVTSSPFNGWIKRQIIFNATTAGYNVEHFNVLCIIYLINVVIIFRSISMYRKHHRKCL